MRLALIGGEGWSSLEGDVAFLAVASGLSVALGLLCFRTALRYERARGTLGLY